VRKSDRCMHCLLGSDMKGILCVSHGERCMSGVWRVRTESEKDVGVCMTVFGWFSEGIWMSRSL